MPQGSTTLDAEVIDIRNGLNSTVYTTAGEAVREQLKDVKQSIDNSITMVNKSLEEKKIVYIF